MSEQQIIDHVPTTQELSPRSTMSMQYTYEPVSRELLNGFDPSVGEDQANLEATLLHNLSNELQFGDREAHGELVRKAYAVAREIGDRSLGSDDAEITELLDETRISARGGVSFAGQSEHAGHVSYRRNESGSLSREMGVAVSGVYTGSPVFRSVENQLLTANVEMKPADISLLMFMQYTGHEAGHLLQTGMNPILQSKIVREGDDPMIYESNRTAAFILTVGEAEGATGNLETDAAIYDERFAEGYGMLVMSECAKRLGYDDRAIEVLKEAMSFTDDNLENVHLLEHVSDDKSLAQVFAEKQIANGNVGEAGYSKPLSASELKRDLRSLVQNFQQGFQTILGQSTYSGMHRMKQRWVAQAARANQAQMNEAVQPEKEAEAGKRHRFTRTRRALGRSGLFGSRKTQ